MITLKFNKDATWIVLVEMDLFLSLNTAKRSILEDQKVYYIEGLDGEAFDLRRRLMRRDLKENLDFTLEVSSVNNQEGDHD